MFRQLYMTTFVGKNIEKNKLLENICYSTRIHTSYRFHTLVHGNKFNKNCRYYCLVVAAALIYIMQLP